MDKTKTNSNQEIFIKDREPAEGENFQHQSLKAISDYAIGLSRIAHDQLFPYICRELKEITGASFVLLNTYNRNNNSITCRYFTASEKEQSLITRLIGRKITGMEVLVSERYYHEIFNNTIKRTASLSETSLGSIPAGLSQLIQKALGVDCYIGVALIAEKRLVGTLLLVGRQENMVVNNDILLSFASISANAVELKETEIKMAENREWYRTIAEDIPAMVTRISPDFRLTFVNNAYSTFMGKNTEELKGALLIDYIPPAYYPQVIAQFYSLNPNNPIASHEHINTNSLGEERWIRWTNRALYNKDGSLVEYLCIGEDITESRTAYQLLEESEALKSSIIAASPDLIIMHDREGVYLDILSSNDELLYQPRDKMIGRKMEEVIPGKVAEEIKGTIVKALETGQMQTMEIKLNIGSNEVYFESRILTSGDNQVITFVRDITSRKKSEKALQESEERYREILDNIEEGYYEVDLFGNMVFFNRSTLKLLGYESDELSGKSYKDLYNDPETVFKAFNRVYQTGKPELGFTLEITRRDGSLAHGELSISPIKDKNNTIIGFRGLARDISERVQFEEKLRYLSMHDQLTGLHNRAYFEAEMERLSMGRSYPITMIAADLDDLKLVNDSFGHHAGDQLLKSTAAILKESMRSDDILARVGGDEFTAILPSTDAETGEMIAARIRNKVDSYNQTNSELPLGLSIGVATAVNKEVSLMEIFKQSDDHMYHDKLYRSSRARKKTVEALMTTLAERDYITEGHASRLADYCRQIGEMVGLTSRQLSDLALLAHVHDLGKVGIPDKILFKKGPLNDEEWKIMRLHPEKGYRIAISSPDLSPVADLILKHHERWDGCGYPIGLAGEDIPLECRILAIVDAYDAMTNDRPYAKAKIHSDALEEIKKSAGTQFDPELVNVFLSLFLS